MGRLARVEVFAADEIAVVDHMNRIVRQYLLPGDDRFTGENDNHRKRWIDDQLIQMARRIGNDLLFQLILSHHIHLVLRSRMLLRIGMMPRILILPSG